MLWWSRAAQRPWNPEMMESHFAVGGHSSPFGETINWSWQAGQNLFYSCCKSRLSTLTVFCNGRDCVNSLQAQVTQDSQEGNMEFCQRQWTVPPDHNAPLCWDSSSAQVGLEKSLIHAWRWLWKAHMSNDSHTYFSLVSSSIELIVDTRSDLEQCPIQNNY